MVWAGISMEAKTELVFVETGGRSGGLTANRYIEEILVHHVVPYAGFIGENFVFMHDNARPHTAASVRQYLEEVEIAAMDWPARSPDLNPIEHLWDHLKRKVRARNPAPTTKLELKEALIEEWGRLGQDRIKKLIGSMKRRLEAVIRARGGNTKY